MSREVVRYARRYARRRAFATACAMAAAGLFAGLQPGAAGALSQRGYEPRGSFTATGGAALQRPAGVAVDESSGDVYVVDSGNNRVERFNSAGQFLRAWGWGVKDGAKQLEVCLSASECKPGLPGHGKGQLHGALDVAVDNSKGPSHGDVYVAAVTPYEEVVAGHEKEFEYAVVDKFSPEGALLGVLRNFEGEPWEEEPVGLAVAGDGSVWIGHEEVLYQFAGDEKNTPIDEIGEGEFGAGPLLAVSPLGNFYVGHFDLGVQVVGELRPNGLAATEALDEEQTTGVAVGGPDEDVFLDHGSYVTSFTPGRQPVQSFGEGILQDGTGLALNAHGGSGGDEPLIYVTDAASGTIDVFGPEAPGAPSIDSLGARKVTAESASLTAEIDPRGYATSYRFRYSSGPLPAAGQPCSATAKPACMEAPLPGGEMGGGFSGVAVAQLAPGLEPSTTYHYSVLAESALEAEGAPVLVQAPAQTFKTQPARPDRSLPDNREWELVSPINKNGGSVYPQTKEGTVIQAAADGGVITYGTSAAVADTEEGAPESEPEGNRSDNIEHVQVVSTREAREWTSTDIDTRHETNETEEGGVVFEGSQYRLFSPDLTTASLTQFGKTRFEYPPLSEAASERTPWLREVDRRCKASPAPESCFTPIVTAAEVAPGVSFGFALTLEAASTNLEHVVFFSSVRLTPEGQAGTGRYLYEWSRPAPGEAPSLKLVSKLTGTQELGAFGVGYGTSGSLRMLAGAVAEDGRVIFNAGGHLYLFDPSAGNDVRLDGSEGAQSASPVFRSASTDGTRIFFTDEAPLTPGSAAKPGAPDLYVCEAPLVPSPSCHLSDLSPAAGAEAAHVVGMLGASADGSSVYFAADGLLAAGAQRGTCKANNGDLAEEPEEFNGHEEAKQVFGLCGLYLEQRGSDGWQAPRLLAELSAEDEPDWALGSRGTARVSADGRWVAFMSDRALGSAASYDTRNTFNGRRDEEVYVYDAAGEASLSCVSCNPTGARPEGLLDESVSEEGQGPVVDRDGVWRERWLAASVPNWNEWNEEAIAYYQPRYLTSGGRVFFDSPEALSPQDNNGKEDVYEWEPAGVGSCNAAREGFDALSGGCVSLLSSGASAHESAFLDASADGRDAYFLTSEALSARDSDTTFDVYDAAACGVAGAPACLPAATGGGSECESVSACRSTGTGTGSPTTPATGSASAGNVPRIDVIPYKAAKPSRAQLLAKALKSCRRIKRHAKRHSCEAAARRRYGPVKRSVRR